MSIPAMECDHNKVRAANAASGFTHAADVKKVTKFGYVFTERTVSNTTKKYGNAARIGWGALGVLASVANFSKKGREMAWEKAWHGQATRRELSGPVDATYAHVEKQLGRPVDKLTDAQRAGMNEHPDGGMVHGDPNIVDLLGYDPKNYQSMRDYLSGDKRAELLEADGNYYLPEHRIDGKSGFLFVPNGDFSKTTFIKISDAKSGEALRGSDFRRAMFSYGAQYEDMTKAMDELATTLVAKLIEKDEKDHPNLNNEQIRERKDWYMKEAKRQMRLVHLDTENGKGRILRRFDVNDISGTLSSSSIGQSFSWSKGTKKSIDEYNKATTDNKLPENKPFSKPPPSSSDSEDSYESDGAIFD